MKSAILVHYDSKGKASTSGPMDVEEARKVYGETELKDGERVELWNSAAGITKKRKHFEREEVPVKGPSFADGERKLIETAKAEAGNKGPAKAEAKEEPKPKKKKE